MWLRSMLTLTIAAVPATFAQDNADFATYYQSPGNTGTCNPVVGCPRDNLVPGSCECERRYAPEGGSVEEMHGFASTRSWPLPVAEATAQCENPYGGRFISAGVTYHFWISPVHPVVGTVQVPMHIHAIGSATANASTDGNPNTQATVEASGTVNIIYAGGSRSWRRNALAQANWLNRPTDTASFNEVTTVMINVSEGIFPPGAGGTVHLSAAVSLFGRNAAGHPTHTDGTAMADPLLEIDPAFPDRDNFRLYVSRNLFCAADVDDGSGTGLKDGGVTLDDLLYYLSLYAEGNPDADLDNGTGTWRYDRAVTIDDLLFYLDHYASGC